MSVTLRDELLHVPRMILHEGLPHGRTYTVIDTVHRDNLLSDLGARL